MNNLVVVSMGYSDLNGLSVEAYRFLFENDISDKKLIARTERHIVVDEIKKKGIAVESLDRFYDEASDFDEMYDSMLSYILECIKERDVILCVPGVPVVGDILVQKLINSGVENVRIISSVGISEKLSEAAAFVADGTMNIVPGHLLTKAQINTRAFMCITEVDNKLLASQIKLMLQDMYPEEYKILYFYGYPKLKYEKISLYSMDRQKIYDFSVNFVILPLDNFEKKLYDIEALFEIMRILRGQPVESDVGHLKYDESGCAWDRVQTHKSIRQNMIEEAYEVVEAINNNDIDNLIEELGDMLLQVIFHSQIASETGEFTFRDVVSGISEKLIRRHPHVFGDVSASDPDGAYAAWENIKAEEKKINKVTTSIDSLPKDLPPMTKALKILKKTEKAGYRPQYSEEAKSVVKCFEDNISGENTGEILMAIVDMLRQKEISPDVELIKYSDEYKKEFS